MVRSSAPGPGRRSWPWPRHPPRGSRNVRMVASGRGRRGAPHRLPRTAGRFHLLLGAQAAHGSRGPSSAPTGALLSTPRRLAGSRGSLLAALGRGGLQLGPCRPVARVCGAPGLILLSSQAAGCGRAGCEPGSLGRGLGSRARTEPLGASHEGLRSRQLPGAGCAGCPAPAPGPELAASASQSQKRAESGEAHRFQLRRESRRARRGGVTSAWGGVLEWGWGESGREERSGELGCRYASRLPVVPDPLMRASKQASGSGARHYPAREPGPAQNLRLCSRILPLSPSCRQTLLNLMAPSGLRGWGPPDTRLPTPGSRAPVRSLTSLSLASSSWIHPQR